MKKIFVFLSLLLSLLTNASHNRSAEILYKQIGPLTYSITVIRYTSYGNSIAYRCVDSVFFGDGQFGIAPRINGPLCNDCNATVNGVTPTCGEIISTQSINLQKKNIYSIIHTYAGPGLYVVSSRDPNRNQGILNIPNSDNQPFYIECLIKVDPIGLNSSPILTNPPIDRARVGECFNFNSAAFDPDGDSLSYEMTTCKGAQGLTIVGYTLPPTNGPFGIDPVSGLFTWCTPSIQGEYNIAFRVWEWRKNGCSGTYDVIGSVTRDMQIIVMAAPSASFSYQGHTDICVVAGSNVSETFSVGSSSGFEVVIYGSASHSSNLPLATISPLSALQNAVTTINWQTNCSHIRKEPHKIVAAYRLNAFVSPKTEYRELNVRVLPPAPKIYKVLKDTTKVILKWQPVTTCAANLKGYNIYRKIGPNTWSHGSCEPGVPASSGFNWIGFTNASDSIYVDGDLWTVPNGSSGNYIVTTVTKDCAESFADSIKTLTLLIGLDELQRPLNSIKLYPNPASEELTIETEKTVSVKIYNALGQLVQQITASKNPSVHLSELSEGLYTVELQCGSAKANRKLIVTH